MNRIKKYVLSITAVTLGLTSCNYLEIEPVGQVIPDKVSAYRALLTEGYRVYPMGSSLSHILLLSDEFSTLLDDEFYSGTQSIQPIFQWNYNDTQMREFEYQYYYRAIFQAIAVIDGIDAAEQDNKESKAQIKAESYALRAYCHFMLCNIYGKWYDPATAATDKAIPLSLKIDIEQKYGPTTVEKVYESVISDLETALSLMVVDAQLQVDKKMYRFSKLSVNALLARVKLYKGDWQGAYDIASTIIDKSKLVDLNTEGLPASNQPWKITSDETIFALDRPFGGGGGDMMYGGVISDKVVALFNDSDKRKTFLKVSGGKYKMNRSSSDQVSLRAAEIYLIAAEAAANISSLNSQAKTLLGTLADNRLTPEGAVAKKAELSAMNQQQLIDEVANERARELLCEGHRWFDLRRTTRPAITKTANGATVTLRQNDSRYIIPYPRSAVEANPNLQQ